MTISENRIELINIIVHNVLMKYSVCDKDEKIIVKAIDKAFKAGLELSLDIMRENISDDNNGMLNQAVIIRDILKHINDI